MEEGKFTKWKKWENKWEYRDDLPEIKFPGVYCIAISESDLSGQDFNLIKEIVYFGMTNHQSLKNRLNQFNLTISQTRWAHGGADRCLNEHRDYEKLLPNLYYSVYPFESKIDIYDPKYIRTMGDILKCENYCIAEYTERFNNELPKFNNPKSPKLPRDLRNKKKE